MKSNKQDRLNKSRKKIYSLENSDHPAGLDEVVILQSIGIRTFSEAFTDKTRKIRWPRTKKNFHPSAHQSRTLGSGSAVESGTQESYAMKILRHSARRDAYPAGDL